MAEDMFREEVLGEALMEECRAAYVKAAHENQRRRSETENATSGSTSNDADSQTRKSGDVSQIETLPRDSPLVKPPTLEEVSSTVMRLGYSFGHAVDKDRIELLADAILHGPKGHPMWTTDEFGRAVALISIDADLAKEISYARTIAPGVFAMAKDRFEVKRGRPLRYAEGKRLASEEQVALSKMLASIRVEGVETNAGNLAPMWRIRPDYEPDADTRAFRPEG
jgi:hypothetical protein